MRKVLFVDDKPEVLRMLKRMLDPIKNEWDMRFVESAPAALAALEQDAFDVLATDMIMPGMDGFQLLKEAKSRYPHMARIAFSWQQGQSLGLRSTDLAHQFREKPIDAQLLRSIMTRAWSNEGDESGIRRVGFVAWSRANMWWIRQSDWNCGA